MIDLICRVAVEGIEEGGVEKVKIDFNLLGGVIMPRGDGTGPNGQGSKSGRGAGYCSGSKRPGFENGQGRGMGNGLRDGNGRGQGLGRNQGSNRGIGRKRP